MKKISQLILAAMFALTCQHTIQAQDGIKFVQPKRSNVAVKPEVDNSLSRYDALAELEEFIRIIKDSGPGPTFPDPQEEELFIEMLVDFALPDQDVFAVLFGFENYNATRPSDFMLAIWSLPQESGWLQLQSQTSVNELPFRFSPGSDTVHLSEMVLIADKDGPLFVVELEDFLKNPAGSNRAASNNSMQPRKNMNKHDIVRRAGQDNGFRRIQGSDGDDTRDVQQGH